MEKLGAQDTKIAKNDSKIEKKETKKEVSESVINTERHFPVGRIIKVNKGFFGISAIWVESTMDLVLPGESNLYLEQFNGSKFRCLGYIDYTFQVEKKLIYKLEIPDVNSFNDLNLMSEVVHCDEKSRRHAISLSKAPGWITPPAGNNNNNNNNNYNKEPLSPSNQMQVGTSLNGFPLFFPNFS